MTMTGGKRTARVPGNVTRPNSHLRPAPTSTHKPYSPRLPTPTPAHMHSDGSPPAKISQGAERDPSGGVGVRVVPPKSAPNSPKAGKYSAASPSAPSFAAVVSALRTAAKSPSTGAGNGNGNGVSASTPFSTLNQQQDNAQAQAQSSLDKTPRRAADRDAAARAKASSNNNSSANGGGVGKANHTQNHNQQQRHHLASPFVPKNLAGSGFGAGVGVGGGASFSVSVSVGNLGNADASVDAAGGDLDHEQFDQSEFELEHEDDQDNDNDQEDLDSESSDVEIYLNLNSNANARGGLHDAAVRMHERSSGGVRGGHDTGADNACNASSPTNASSPSVADTAMAIASAFSGLRIGNNSAVINSEANARKSLSPLPTSAISPPSAFLQAHAHPQQLQLAAKSVSPQLPQAPVHGTIPLPQIEEYEREQERARELHDRDQQTQNHQNEYSHREDHREEHADHARQLRDLQFQHDAHDAHYSHSINHRQNNNNGGNIDSFNHNNNTNIISSNINNINHSSSNNNNYASHITDVPHISIEAASGGLHSNDLHSGGQYGSSQSQSYPVVRTTKAFSPRYMAMLARNNDREMQVQVQTYRSATGQEMFKSSNVYINGLPPDYPEDELFETAEPYGEVLSVRTFTRVVRGCKSGYGFVLYDLIEEAERCINSLRRFRNLHPTFSKQVHKIPGTTYTENMIISPPTAWAQGSSASSADGYGGEWAGEMSSFKAKMESLQDPKSTNLYMEGLPLKISEYRLAQLVAPHNIVSYRTFPTKLSHPTRAIAFVRLGSREGAEEVIHRLHGRMIPGDSDDPGGRISVRFADTSEQREMRRTQRAMQEDDGMPVNLTIAQAALLNLRGQDLRLGQSVSPVMHAHSLAGTRVASGTGFVPRPGLSASLSVPDFASNSHQEFMEVDYSLGARVPQSQSRSRSPYHAQGLGYQQDTFSNHAPVGLGHTPPPPPMNPEMAALLSSLSNSNIGNNGYHFNADELSYMHEQIGLGGRHQQPQYQHQQPQQQQMSSSQSLDNLHQYARTAPAYTRSGYTPTEEYIMRAHAETVALAQAQAQAQLDRRRPAPLDFSRRRGEEEGGQANIAVGMRGYRAQASLAPMVSVNGMGYQGQQDDFQSSAPMVVRNDLRQQQQQQRHNTNLHPPHVNARLSRDASLNVGNAVYQHSPSLTSPAAEMDSPSLNDAINYQHAAAHMRSTTLPQRRSSSVRDQQQAQGHVGGGRGHYQHNSLSMPAQNLRTPQHASVAQMGGAGGIEGVHGGSSTIYENDAQDDLASRHHHQQQQQQQQSPRNGGNAGNQTQGAQNVIGSGHASAAPGGNAKAQQQHHYSNSSNMYGDLEAPSSSPTSLISPTLTYGTGTPSTLSPATPFFGTFNSQSEGFEKGANGGPGMDNQQPQRKASSGALNSSSLNPSSLRNQ